MKKSILALSLVLASSLVNAGNTHTPKMPKEVPAVSSGGFTDLSANSGFVLGFVVGTVVQLAIQQNKYDCVTYKVPPKEGTNYTNEVSICTDTTV